MSFDIGQHIECIDDYINPGQPGPYPVLGVVYTVHSILLEPVSGPWGNGFQETVLVVELPANPVSGWCTGYECDSFRPVDENRISVFRKIAASPRKRIEVDA